MGEPERYVGHRATRECGGCGVRVGELCRVTCPELTRQLVGTTWHYRLDYQDRLTVLWVEDGQVWRETGEPYGSVTSLFNFRVDAREGEPCPVEECIGTVDLTRGRAGECEACLTRDRDRLARAGKSQGGPDRLARAGKSQGGQARMELGPVEPKSPGEWSSIIREQMTKLERAGVIYPCPSDFTMLEPPSSEPPEAPEQEPDRLLAALRCTATRFAARSEPLSAKAAQAMVRMCRRVEQALVVRAEPCEMNRYLPPDLRKVARWLVIIAASLQATADLPLDPAYERDLLAWLERQVYPLFVVRR